MTGKTKQKLDETGALQTRINLAIAGMKRTNSRDASKILSKDNNADADRRVTTAAAHLSGSI